MKTTRELCAETRTIMKAKTWNRIVIGGLAALLLLLAAITIIIDPFLHYHAPLGNLQYPLKDERYQNDGIARHYEYDAVITGTSMTQNFKTSEMDALFGCTSIKTSYSGASYNEINDNIERAFSHNPDIRYILRSIDGSLLIYPADQNEYDGYPYYLYDNNPFNDVNYLLNKSVIPKTIAVINYTRAGNKTPTFDEYGNWSIYKTFGRDAILSSQPERTYFDEEYVLSEADYKNIRENVTQNVLQCATEHPDTEFYLFFPPYSIYYWEALHRTKQLNAQMEAEQIAVEILLEADNIHIFAFSDDTEMLSNPDNYTDALHYGEWINSSILQSMHDGEHQLTKDNYEEYYATLIETYSSYDYSSLYD